MLKRLAAVAVAGVLGGALAFAIPAQAAADHVFTNTVEDVPDNHCPTWARDTFKRTTEVTAGQNQGEYDIYQHIEGTFESTGTPKIKGTITGYVKYMVTGELKSDFTGIDGATVDLSGVDCKQDVDSDSVDKTGNWALRFFKDGATAGPITDWQYTYATPCKTHVEEEGADAVGADTFSPCPVTPGAPTVKPYDCAKDGNAGDLLIPDQQGVVYSHTSGPVKAGDYTVTSEPADGYTFPNDLAAKWELTVQAVDECGALPDTSGVKTLPMLLGGGALLLILGGAALIFARRRPKSL